MSPLGKYYVLGSFVFLIAFICNIIFSSAFSVCPISSNSSPLFLIIGVINIIIFILMFADGFLINYFSQKDAEDFKSYGLIMNILGIVTKLIPLIVKILNLLKMFLFLILTILVIIAITGEITVSPVDPLIYPNCPVEVQQKIAEKYSSQILIFYILESTVLCVSCLVFGIVKSFIPEEGFLYNPLGHDAGAIRKMVMKNFGP